MPPGISGQPQGPYQQSTKRSTPCSSGPRTASTETRPTNTRQSDEKLKHLKRSALQLLLHVRPGQRPGDADPVSAGLVGEHTNSRNTKSASSDDHLASADDHAH